MRLSPEDSSERVRTLEKKKQRIVLIIWITVAFILLQPLLGSRLPEAIAILVSGLGTLMFLLGLPVELFFWNRLRKRVRKVKEIEKATRPPKDTSKDKPEDRRDRNTKRLPATFWRPGNIIAMLIVLPFVAVIASIVFQQVEMESVASREHDAIRPGMDLAEVFTVARNWSWAYPSTDEGEHGPMVSSYDGASASFGDKSYADWDSLLADLVERKEELLPYTRWMFTYRGGAFVKRSYSIYFENGKVARVSESQNYD